VEWVAKHGAAARKEAAIDAERMPPGPTWSSAIKQPFRVLHAKASPPPPMH
jgi:hypothetical protein